jgi:sulfide:quinone oxidoreductase
MAVDEYIPVDKATLASRYPGVYAIGDCATVGVPKAGAFAEGAGRAVAEQLIAAVRGEPPSAPYRGVGSCYVEFGGGRVGAVRIDASGEPPPRGAFEGPSEALAAEKREFGASRRARWFGS